MNIFDDFFPIATRTILILLALTCLVIAYFKRAFNYWTRLGVEQAKPRWPLGNIGSTVLQREHIGENLLKLYKKYKTPGRRFIGVYCLTEPELLILDPSLVKSVMITDFQFFSHRGLHHNAEREPLSAHLISLSGKRWKTLRQKLTPTFTSAKMKMMFSTIVACSSHLKDTLEDFVVKNEAIDIKDVLGRFTTDNIGSCAFGIECNSLNNPDSEFRKHGKLAFEPNPLVWFQRMVSYASPKLYDLLRMEKVDKRVRHFFSNAVKDTVEYREKNKVKRNDFLQLMINIKNTGDVEGLTVASGKDTRLTMDEITAQCYLFFLAGFETSSTAMTFFLYDLATNQDIQERVRQEIQDMLKRHDGKVTYEGVMELKYTERALNESMRLHAPFPIMSRQCTSDYKIPDSDVIIQKGTRVLIPIVALHSDPEYYPEPHKYDPDRFLQEEKDKRPSCTFLPFGEGPRYCIAAKFGLLQAKVGIIELLKYFRFTLNSRTKMPLQIDPKNFIISALGGIWLDVQHL